MNKKITIGISILLLIIIVGINISYASRSQNEKDFLKLNKEEITPGETLEITFDISSLEYKKFKILLNSNIDVKDIYTKTNENIEIEDKEEAISIEINKEQMTLEQITLYYPIQKDIEIGTKIQLTAKIIVNNEIKEENQTSNNIVSTETNTTNTENDSNNEKQEEIVKEITKIITVVEENAEKQDEEETNNPSDKNQENKQEIPNEEKSNSKQEQNNNNEKMSNNIEQKNNVSENMKSSLSETSTNIENQTIYNGSSNNYLANLEIEGINLNTSFNKENGTYFIEINNTSTINITATAEDSEARVYITGNDNIQNGNNKILISVTAENGEVRYYRVFINYKEGTDET